MGFDTLEFMQIAAVVEDLVEDIKIIDAYKKTYH